LFAGAFLLLALGAALMLGPSIGQCLGPLGVTGIQCARATGAFPSVGAGLPTFVACIAIAVLVGYPSLRRWPTVIGMGIGFVAAAAAYLVVRPTTWTGPTSTGEVITLALPLDVTALALAALLGGLAGMAVGWIATRPRRA
jgi:hypothetical protein